MISKREYTFEGLPVQVVRRPRMKNIRVRIAPPGGDIVLSCPYGVRNYEWESVLREAWPELMSVRKKYLQSCQEVISPAGGYCCLWGRRYELKVVFTEHACFARCVDGHVVAAVPPGSGREQVEDCLYDLYRRELNRVLPHVFPQCERLTGLRAGEVRLKRMQTRWGSCNIGARRIWLSLNLAKKPPECLRYVIIHELVHLLEKNHTPRFHALVAVFYPDWQQAEKGLKGDICDGGQ